MAQSPEPEKSTESEKSPKRESQPAQRKKSTGVPHAGFVKALAGEGGEVTPPACILGYPGASSLSEHTRFYFRADLNYYMDVPDAAILAHEPAQGIPGPPGLVCVWFEPDAEVVVGGFGMPHQKGRFFAPHPWPSGGPGPGG